METWFVYSTSETMVNKKILSISLLLFCIFWTTFFICHKYLQNRPREQTEITTYKGIDSVEKITLGGIDQWILIRGWNRSNPVVLFLHGGPGAPLFTYARDVGVEARLEQHFVMVYWEQRGTGKSFNWAMMYNFTNSLLFSVILLNFFDNHYDQDLIFIVD